jgi:hypothetical protein
MPLTVASVENEVVGRLRGKLTALSLSTVNDGTNVDLAGPIRKALSYLGLAAADPVAAVDDDVSGITGQDAERFYDAVTLEALYVCLGNCVGIDEQVGTNLQKNSQIADQIRALIKVYEDKLTKPFGPNVPRSACGQLAGGDPMVNDPLNPYRSASRPGYWPYP